MKTSITWALQTHTKLVHTLSSRGCTGSHLCRACSWLDSPAPSATGGPPSSAVQHYSALLSWNPHLSEDFQGRQQVFTLSKCALLDCLILFDRLLDYIIKQFKVKRVFGFEARTGLVHWKNADPNTRVWCRIFFFHIFAPVFVHISCCLSCSTSDWSPYVSFCSYVYRMLSNKKNTYCPIYIESSSMPHSTRTCGNKATWTKFED